MDANTVLLYAGTLLGAYLIGAVPFGLLIGFLNGKDVRKEGSCNIGATNVTRVVGKWWGKLCFLCDFLKGFLPVILTMRLLDPGSGWLTALLGTALGTGASLVLLDRVQTWMLQGVTGGETLGKFSGGTPLTEEALQAMIDACRLGPGQLLLLAAAELAIFAAALALHAYILSRKTPRTLLGV